MPPPSNKSSDTPIIEQVLIPNKPTTTTAPQRSNSNVSDKSTTTTISSSSSSGDVEISTPSSSSSSSSGWWVKRFRLLIEFLKLAEMHKADQRSCINHFLFPQGARTLPPTSSNANKKNSTTAATMNGTLQDRLKQLQEKCPESKPNERHRFLKARRYNVKSASKKLTEYLQWRRQHNLDDENKDDNHPRQHSNNSARHNENDQVSNINDCDGEGVEIIANGNDLDFATATVNNQTTTTRATTTTTSSGNNSSSLTADEWDWKESCRVALEWAARTGEGSKTTTILPQMAFVNMETNNDDFDNRGSQKTLQGSVVLQIIPARVDRSLASPETYSLALALYLDKKFDRNSLDLATLFIDVRGGHGWSNPPAIKMMPFIRSTSKLLHQFYPNRLDRCILYPLPRAALWIWEMAKPFLDRVVVESITLVSGSDAADAPLPRDELCEIVERSVLDEMEIKRMNLMATTTIQ